MLDVLIETYWNVNITKYNTFFATFIVLIETYWNVNTLTYYVDPVSRRVLIETYWNVNVTHTRLRRSPRRS